MPSIGVRRWEGRGVHPFRRTWSRTIRPLLAAAVIVGAIAGPVAAFTRFTIGTLESDLLERARADRSEVAQLTAHLVDVALVGAGRELMLVSSRPSLREALRRGEGEAARTHLADLRAAGEHSGATLIGASGVVLARDPHAADLIGVDVSDRDYFRGALASETWHASEAYLARGTSRAPLVSVSLALRDAGRALGVLQVTFTPQQILSAVQPVRPGAGRDIAILDARGRMVASTDPAHAPLSLQAELLSLAPPAGSVRTGQTDLSGDHREYASTVIPSGDWVLFVVDDPALLLATEHRLFGEVGTAAAIAAVIALGLAIAFALLYRALVIATERLREQAITDELTGLFNRRFLETQLRLLTESAARTGRPYALLAIDLDGMKRINDAFGHAAGDQILREFARTLTGALRASDVAVRAGGDEFLALLPDTGLAKAAEVAQRLRRALGRRYVNVPEMAVGASIGVAEWRVGRTVDDVLVEADRLLYEAKREGKGRVMCEPPAPPRLRVVGA
jgi:diguanylate cyclase (GGDEF)-like protein